MLLVSTYELGHQPLHVASPAAALIAAGHEVAAWDLAVDPWDERADELVSWADALGVSVPMHTAMRLAVRLIRQIRSGGATLPVCLYGLYAPLAQEPELADVADHLITGEYLDALVEWVGTLGRTGGPRADPDRHRSGEMGQSGPKAVRVELGKTTPFLPARHLLPPLERYAHLDTGSGEVLAGYVEASHGCRHRCTHCPVPLVYDGRTRIVGTEALLADIGQLVASGASHITFGDPDFLNGPRHALRVLNAVHDAYPQLSFDCTVKVEHILAHEPIWKDVARLGCLFVVSALESADEATLVTLDKGHTVADAARAVAILDQAGIQLRPSWLPFSPWTTLDHIAQMVDFIAQNCLISATDPVHYGIRLLLPPGSALLDRQDVASTLVAYDPDALSWTWVSPDPAVDALQAKLASIAEDAARCGVGVDQTWEEVRSAVAQATSRPLLGARVSKDCLGSERRPRLTESWFC